MLPDAPYRLYAILGSHSCRSATLMLEHKRLAFTRVDLVSGLHAGLMRLHGFDADRRTRPASDHRPFPFVLGDRLATVPALVVGQQRISTNRRIARWLDARHPDRPLLPKDSAHRAAVAAAEDLTYASLQMTARRLLLNYALHDPSGFASTASGGRLGPLLYRRPGVRRVVMPLAARGGYDAGPAVQPQLLNELSHALDQIDGWCAHGVLDGPTLNVADLTIAPCLALVLYRPDGPDLLAGRPAAALVDRVLPAPT